MQVNKTQSLLYIFDTLITKGGIKKADVINELEISDLKFKRYIQELRAYIYNFDKGYDLVYEEKSQEYILKNY